MCTTWNICKEGQKKTFEGNTKDGDGAMEVLWLQEGKIVFTSIVL
jgi:hypothetical protein